MIGERSGFRVQGFGGSGSEGLQEKATPNPERGTLNGEF